MKRNEILVPALRKTSSDAEILFHTLLLRVGITWLLPALLLLTLPAAVQAQFTYTTNNGTITITKYTGTGGAVTIPDTINDLPVTTIGYQAFYYCPNLTNAISVIIGNNVTTIGDDAFFCCAKLTSVAMTNGVASIGYQAFYNCTALAGITMSVNLKSIGQLAFAYCASLTNITIPGSVTNIGVAPFEACTALTAITVDATNAFYSSVAGVLFNKSQTALIQCPGGKAGSYTIPDGVTNLAEASFFGCASLTSVIIPNTVTGLGNYIFEYCTNLTHITIPPSVTSIVDYAFCGCFNLTNVSLPRGVTSIGYYAFASCTNLTSIIIPKSVTSIAEYAFAWCNNLTAIFFEGNAPPSDPYILYGSNPSIYYLPGTTGWNHGFANRPAILWNPQFQTGDASFGVRTNVFGFNITGTTNFPIVLEACTNLVNSVWEPLQNCNLTNGSIYFSDPDWSNYSTRLYRIRSP